MKMQDAILTTIAKVKRGDFLRLTDSDTAPVWIRGNYDKGSKTYSIYKYDDANHELFCKGSRKCYTEFYF